MPTTDRFGTKSEESSNGCSATSTARKKGEDTLGKTGFVTPIADTEVQDDSIPTPLHEWRMMNQDRYAQAVAGRVKDKKKKERRKAKKKTGRKAKTRNRIHRSKFDATLGYPGEGPEEEGRYEKCPWANGVASEWSRQCLDSHSHRLASGAPSPKDGGKKNGKLSAAKRRLREKEVRPCRNPATCTLPTHFHEGEIVIMSEKPEVRPKYVSATPLGEIEGDSSDPSFKYTDPDLLLGTHKWGSLPEPAGQIQEEEDDSGYPATREQVVIEDTREPRADVQMTRAPTPVPTASPTKWDEDCEEFYRKQRRRFGLSQPTAWLTPDDESLPAIAEESDTPPKDDPTPEAPPTGATRPARPLPAVPPPFPAATLDVCRTEKKRIYFIGQDTSYTMLQNIGWWFIQIIPGENISTTPYDETTHIPSHIRTFDNARRKRIIGFFNKSRRNNVRQQIVRKEDRTDKHSNVASLIEDYKTFADVDVYPELFRMFIIDANITRRQVLDMGEDGKAAILESFVGFVRFSLSRYPHHETWALDNQMTLMYTVLGFLQDRQRLEVIASSALISLSCPRFRCGTLPSTPRECPSTV